MFYANKVTLQIGNCQRKSKLIGLQAICIGEKIILNGNKICLIFLFLFFNVKKTAYFWFLNYYVIQNKKPKLNEYPSK